MTKEEALIYLPVSDGVDLEDVYDERMFSFREFFISSVPTTALYSAKISQLKMIHKAYEILADEKIAADFSELELLPYTEENIFDLVIAFQKNNSSFKYQVMMSESMLDLIDLAEQMLINMKNYALCWRLDLKLEGVDVKVTQPTDELELLKELELLHKDGRATLAEIPKLNSKSCVFKEAIRLSLWRKLEGHV